MLTGKSAGFQFLTCCLFVIMQLLRVGGWVCNELNRMRAGFQVAYILAYKGGYMSTMQLQEGIRDINLTYLMLAQQMIKEDRSAAIFRLGISQDLVDIIAGLTPAQVIKMAASNMLLCRFRFDENLLLNMVTGYSKDRMMSQAHAAILMSAQPVEELA